MALSACYAKGLRDLIITTNVCENGRNVSRYVPTEQVPELRKAIEGYHQVQALMAQYLQLLVERTRSERAADAKKKSRHHNSSWLRNKKSNN